MTTTDDKPASIADQIRALHKKARREDGYGYAMAFRDAADIAAAGEAALRAEVEALRADRDRLAADMAVALEALRGITAASLNDMTTQGLPLEWSEGSAIAKALEALGVKADRMNGDVARALSGNWIDGWDSKVVSPAPRAALARIKEAD